MKFISLFSGSKGNASLIVNNSGEALLLDCGVSFSKIKKAVQTAGVSPDDIQGILITHEHSDHVCGLSVLLSHWDKPVYCNRRTALALPYVTENVVISENGAFEVGGFTVQRFSTYHDAAGPCGYCIFADGKKISALTDCGLVDASVLSQIGGCDMAYIESNYDETMLSCGPYPSSLKCRIRSPKGHLSNTDCAQTVQQLALLGCKKVLLGHISENNNTHMLAAATTMDALRKLGQKVVVEVADERDRITVVEVQ